MARGAELEASAPEVANRIYATTKAALSRWIRRNAAIPRMGRARASRSTRSHPAWSSPR